MIDIYKKSLKDTKIKKIKRFAKGSWISVINPNIKEIELIAEKFNLDLTIIEDALDENEISRVEKNDDVFYFIIRFPVQSDSNATTIPLLIVITRHNIITLCKDENDLIERIIRHQNSCYTTHKTGFLLRIISEAFKSYESNLKRILKDIQIKKINIKHLDNRDILFLVQEEETLNNFVSATVPIISNLERILSGRYIRIFEKDKNIIEDLFMDSKQTLEISRTALKSIGNIREAYSTILSNDLNKTMKFLTVVTIVMTVPTIIASLFGMNVMIPMKYNPHAFSYIMLIVIFSTLLLLFILKRKRWI